MNEVLDDDLDDQDFVDFADETDEERKAREETEVDLDPQSQAFVDSVVAKMLLVTDEISEHPLYPYQIPLARRVIQSLVLNDGATLTALFARQSGKTETIANAVAACMIVFPRLAKLDGFKELLGKFSEGMWVGAFAPVQDQAENLFGRIVSRLTSDTAVAFMADPEIDDAPTGGSKILKLKRSGSFVRMQTAHPRATIEGRTYHLIIIDEAQGADTKMVNKSIAPMRSATNGTIIMTGTPTYEKGVFYQSIQINKRMATKRGQRVNHFEADWKACARANPNYGRSIKQELLRIGEDSDEFKLSYRLMWLLDRGMFTTSERMDELGDKSMQVVHSWFRSPVVVGIDPARKQDSTIVTVVWVDWDNPDEFGYFDHRVLNWLDLSGTDWEEQYFRIVEFLSNYNVMAAGVDVGGMGDVVIDRLRRLMPNIDWHPLGSQRPDQSKRWKHLGELMRRNRLGWPAHAKTRRLKTYRRFRQQMEDLEQNYEGPYVLAQAPRETDAHDDYADSLAMACILTGDLVMPEVEQSVGTFHK